MTTALKSNVSESGSTLTIKIPSRRGRMETVYLFLGLTLGLAFIWFGVFEGILNHRPDISGKEQLSSISAGSVLSFAAIILLLYKLFGREIVTASPDILTIRRQVCGIGFTFHYEPDRIKNIKISNERFMLAYSYNRKKATREPVQEKFTSIAFDYGQNRAGFGASLGREEQEILIGMIKQRIHCPD